MLIDRFTKFGNWGTFGTPIVLLMIGIILPMLIVEDGVEYPADKGKRRVSSVYSESTDPTEESPLLNGIEEVTRLSAYHYIHPVLLAVVFAVITASCVLSAFETVCYHTLYMK